MKIKTIKIPIYLCELTMILDKDLKYVQKKYKTSSLENYGAVVLKDQEGYRRFVVAFTDKNHISNIVHEIVHLKNNIFLECAMEVDRFNDEPEAYLSAYLFDKIYKFLNK
jgi:hypothetical protein